MGFQGLRRESGVLFESNNTSISHHSTQYRWRLTVCEREREGDIRQQPITNTFSNLRRTSTSDVKPGMKMSDIKRFSDNYISNHFSHKASMMNELYAVWDICLLELIEKGFSH